MRLIFNHFTGSPSRQGLILPAIKPFLLILVLALLLGVFSGCTQDDEVRGELRNILDEHHEIRNPSKNHASASGYGCGFNRKEAINTARRIADYNLRSLTGVAKYNTAYRVLKQHPDLNNYCVEVLATASP